MEFAKASFYAKIDHIPIDWEPVIFDANTPFTSYLRIKEAIVAVKDRLHYFDRYLKPEFFELFLATVDRGTSIRLVTTAGANSSGSNASGVAAVAAVARLARQEFKDLQLLQVDPSQLHDRNMRVDDRIFTLGPGVDRAGMALTNFGPADSSPEAHGQFDELIARGTVVT